MTPGEWALLSGFAGTAAWLLLAVLWLYWRAGR